ncbi:MAG: phage tail protein [Desulfobulbaceae bacterium]|nr:phage tail protein [Desulfobulbaceae bacterium]
MIMPQRKDPFTNYHFIIELDSITRAGFRECAGIDSAQAPIEYREGNEALTPRKLPSLNKYSNITLKWGTTTDDELWKWRKTAIDGKVERKNGSIILLDDAGDEQVRWDFKDAWPTKWTGPSFNATGNEVAIEALELTHEGVEKV